MGVCGDDVQQKEDNEIDELQSEEEQIIDNRSIPEEDMEMELPSYYCFFCKQPHFHKGFDSSPTCAE